MKGSASIIDEIMHTELRERYDLVQVPYQIEAGWHSAIAHIRDKYNPAAPVVLLKVQQYKKLNPREAFGLRVMSHYPGAIRIPELIEEGERFTIQELCPGVPLDSAKHAIPESYAAELGKLLAWQMFPPADIQIMLKQKAVDPEFGFYPVGHPPKRIIATGALRDGHKQTPGDVFTDENERDEFIKTLSIPHPGFNKGDWRLTKTLYDSTVASEIFYSIDYGYSYIVAKNESHLFEKRVAAFDLTLFVFGEAFAKRMVDSFSAEAKIRLSR